MSKKPLKYYMAYDGENTIWGIGESREEAIKDAEGCLGGESWRSYAESHGGQVDECTKVLHDAIEKDGQVPFHVGDMVCQFGLSPEQKTKDLAINYGGGIEAMKKTLSDPPPQPRQLSFWEKFNQASKDINKTLTMGEVAERTGKSLSHISRLVRLGAIPKGVKRGKHRHLPTSVVDDILSHKPQADWGKRKTDGYKRSAPVNGRLGGLAKGKNLLQSSNSENA